MKKKSCIIIASVFLVSIIATVFAQIRVHRFYEDNYGIVKQYYAMSGTVPFGENLTEQGGTMDGCSIRIDKAEILTGSEFLERVGQTEETLADLLGSEVTSVLSERLCFLTVTVLNDSSEDKNYDLGDFTLTGENYDVSLDSKYTILANRFLLDAHKDEMGDFWGGMGKTGIHMNPGQEVELHIVYAFSKMDFSARKWDLLNDEPLWLQITYSPVEKYIALELS